MSKAKQKPVISFSFTLLLLAIATNLWTGVDGLGGQEWFSVLCVSGAAVACFKTWRHSISSSKRSRRAPLGWRELSLSLSLGVHQRPSWASQSMTFSRPIPLRSSSWSCSSLLFAKMLDWIRPVRSDLWPLVLRLIKDLYTLTSALSLFYLFFVLATHCFILLLIKQQTYLSLSLSRSFARFSSKKSKFARLFLLVFVE